MPETTASIITGASSGIGRAIHEKLIGKFTSCYNLDINPPEENLEKFIQTDVSEIEDVDEAVKKITQSGEKIKCLISNAGVGVHEKLTEGDPLKWKKAININVVGTLNVIRAFLPLMNEGGDVIFISSVAANNIFEYGGVYGASKVAINRIAETLRIETDENIRVSIIEPGMVSSSFMKNTISGARSYDEVPFRSLDAEHVASAVEYVIKQPIEVSVNQITIRPSDQTF